MASVLLAHVSASLDAISYIIAIGVVDMMTFGRPVQPFIVESEKRGLASSSGRSGKLTPRRTTSDPGSGSGLPSPPPLDTSYLASTPGPWQRRTGSIDDYLLPRSPSVHARRTQRSGSDAGRGDGCVHHYQVKLFSKQMNRAVRLQPYVKASLVASILTLTALFASFMCLLLLQGSLVSALDRITSTALALWSHPCALLAKAMSPIYPPHLQA